MVASSRSASAASPAIPPARSTVTWLASARTSRSLWEMKITVSPSARSWRRRSNSSAVSCGVSTAVGSSRISTRTRRASAFRISTFCCAATESRPTTASGSTPSR